MKENKKKKHIFVLVTQRISLNHQKVPPVTAFSFAPILQLMNLYCEGSETHFLLHGLADVRQGLQCNYANQMCPNNCL